MAENKQQSIDDVKNLKDKITSIFRLDLAGLAALASLFFYIHSYVMPRTEMGPIKRDIQANQLAIETMANETQTQLELVKTELQSAIEKQGSNHETQMREISKRVDRIYELLTQRINAGLIDNDYQKAN